MIEHVESLRKSQANEGPIKGIYGRPEDGKCVYQSPLGEVYIKMSECGPIPDEPYCEICNKFGCPFEEYRRKNGIDTKKIVDIMKMVMDEETSKKKAGNSESKNGIPDFDTEEEEIAYFQKNSQVVKPSGKKDQKIKKPSPDKKSGNPIKKLHNLNEFNSTIKNSLGKLVVVDFFAQWCPPCKEIEPRYKKLAEEFRDVLFCKVDVDENEKTSQACKIKCMPTFQLYKNGSKVGQVEGSDLEGLIAAVLKDK